MSKSCSNGTCAEACEPDTYKDAHGWPEYENSMFEECFSSMNNKTWYLVHQQGNKTMKC